MYNDNEILTSLRIILGFFSGVTNSYFLQCIHIHAVLFRSNAVYYKANSYRNAITNGNHCRRITECGRKYIHWAGRNSLENSLN